MDFAADLVGAFFAVEAVGFAGALFDVPVFTVAVDLRVLAVVVLTLVSLVVVSCLKRYYRENPSIASFACCNAFERYNMWGFCAVILWAHLRRIA